MPNLENKRTLRPDSSLFWMQIFSDKPTICMILLGFIWFTLGSWKWMAPDGDPLAEFLAEYGAIIWGGFAVTLAMAAVCIGVERHRTAIGCRNNMDFGGEHTSPPILFAPL